ncbi:MAG TPA: TonB-dependent receptor [Gemmatimonadaceae bacterium]|nr:TonB-dependent receptor [Gemmatimonadaceae bacterium]
MIFAAASRAAAQDRSNTPTGGEIRGRVVSAAGSVPVGSARVDVTSTVAGAPTTQASTAADGSFSIQNLAPGRYRVRIRALGYAARDLPPVEISSSSPSVDAGTVTLSSVAVELQSQVVTGQRQEVRLAPDRNTYVVGDMPTNKGGTALDVLRNVPSVDVDIDNIVSLRGNSGVIVQINGRPSPLKPAQLGNFLAQLSADMVDKVEVIPNPSARDDPEGVAGIINIVLKQKTDVGTSGGLTLAAGTTGHVDVGGNVGVQRGPLTLYGSYGFMRDRRPRRDSIYRENLYLNPLTYLEETGRRMQVPLMHTVTGSATYQPGENDEITSEVVFSTRNQPDSYKVGYTELDAAHNVTALSDRFTDGRQNEMNLESTLGYKHTFTDKGHSLEGELRFFRNREGGPGSVVARDLALDGTPIDTSALERQVAWERPSENSVKLDYARPLTDLVRLEMGYKGSLQNYHTTLDTRVFDVAQSAYLPDSTRISDFTYRQLVNAGYGMLDAEVGKFQLQGGLRLERATTRFHLNTSDSTYDNQYNSFFPSALVAYNFDDAHQVKLSYSTRIRRPDDTDLIDPTAHYADPLNLSRGNPYLKPEYIRALEFGVQSTQGHTTIQVTPFFRRTLDAVRTLRSIDTAGVATRTFANISTSNAYGTDVTVALGGDRVSGFAGASGFRQVSNAANIAPGLSAQTFGWTARTNATLHLSSALDLQTLLFYQAPMTVEQGKNAARMRFSFAVRQKLMQDKMSLTLRVIDPFNTSRESNTTIDPRFYQVSDRTRSIRGLLLSANWTFGKPPKVHKSEDLVGPDVGSP